MVSSVRSINTNVCEHNYLANNLNNLVAARVDNNSSTISSCSIHSDDNCVKRFIKALFSPIIWVWNLIFKKNILNINKTKLEDDYVLLNIMDDNIKSSDLKSFKKNYNNLSEDGKNVFNNIYYEWVITHSSDAPYLNIEKYIEENFSRDCEALSTVCLKSYGFLEKLIKIRPFVQAINISKFDAEKFNINKKSAILNSFARLDKKLQEEIKHTIWKALKPKNSNDSDFGGTILKQHADEPFIKDVVVALVKGLKSGHDYHGRYDPTQWMPEGWKSRIPLPLKV